MGWASGLQAGIRLGETIRQGQLEGALAEEAKKYKVTEGAYGSELGGNIEQLRGLQQQNPELANQYEPAIAELQRRQAMTAPDYSVGSRGPNLGMEEAQRGVSQARTQGLADVYRQYGQIDKASEMEARAQQQQLTGLQLRKGQREEDTETKILDIDKQAGDFMAKRLIGEDGKTRAATPDDMIAQIQHRATLLQQGGLGREATNALKDWQSIAANSIQLTTAERNNELGRVATAIAAGDLGPARAFYDKYVLDGAKVTDLKPNKDGSITVSRVRDDGAKLPDTRIESTGALLSTLNSFRDPMALYNYSQDQFKNNLQSRQVAATEKSANTAAANSEAYIKRLDQPQPGALKTFKDQKTGEAVIVDTTKLPQKEGVVQLPKGLVPVTAKTEPSDAAVATLAKQIMSDPKQRVMKDGKKVPLSEKEAGDKARRILVKQQGESSEDLSPEDKLIQLMLQSQQTQQP